MHTRALVVGTLARVPSEGLALAVVLTVAEKLLVQLFGW